LTECYPEVISLGQIFETAMENLLEKNLDEATFEDKRDIMNKLDIRVYPSEDLKTVKIKCGLTLDIEDKDEIADVDGCEFEACMAY